MIPSFFYDDSDSDKYEETMDMFIAWTLRCAQDEVGRHNQKLQEYAKQILFRLLFGDTVEERAWRVKAVRTKRQWKHLDILAEIELIDEQGKEHFYLLAIEDKVYSSLTSGQLLRYREVVEANYPKEKWTIRQVVIAIDDCNYEKGNYRKTCLESGVSLYNVDELSPVETPPHTGNCLFDEFWFRFNKSVFGIK